MRGTSKSNFEFQLGIKNDSGKKVTVSLAAQAPQNFDATFTEQYGSQELNALPLDAGQSKDVKLKVRPPNTVAAGKYNVMAKVSAEDASASTDLVLDITGQPKIDIAGRDGRLNASASAGAETSVPVVITNSGTAAADQVELSGSGPSGWKVNFEPKTVDRIAPNETKDVQALITPPAKAIAGDYVTTLRAAARGKSASQTFRIAVVDLDHVGNCGRRAYRDCAAGSGRRCCLVWPPMSDTVIEARNLTKRYGGTTVVKGVSFTVQRGEIFGLLGPNGAGKTTTILMLLGLSDISSGTARVLGDDPARQPLAVKRRVGYLPDQSRFL